MPRKHFDFKKRTNIYFNPECKIWYCHCRMKLLGLVHYIWLSSPVWIPVTTRMNGNHRREEGINESRNWPFGSTKSGDHQRWTLSLSGRAGKKVVLSSSTFFFSLLHVFSEFISSSWIWFYMSNRNWYSKSLSIDVQKIW